MRSPIATKRNGAMGASIALTADDRKEQDGSDCAGTGLLLFQSAFSGRQATLHTASQTVYEKQFS